jgi:hypothetical protein
LFRLLSQRGVNLQSCFLKQGKSKYVFISLHAACTLMRTDFGPFKVIVVSGRSWQFANLAPEIKL